MNQDFIDYMTGLGIDVLSYSNLKFLICHNLYNLILSENDPAKKIELKLRLNNIIKTS